MKTIQEAIEAMSNLIYINRHEHPPCTKHLQTALSALRTMEWINHFGSGTHLLVEDIQNKFLDYQKESK